MIHDSRFTIHGFINLKSLIFNRSAVTEGSL